MMWNHIIRPKKPSTTKTNLGNWLLCNRKQTKHFINYWFIYLLGFELRLSLYRGAFFFTTPAEFLLYWFDLVCSDMKIWPIHFSKQSIRLNDYPSVVLVLTRGQSQCIVSSFLGRSLFVLISAMVEVRTSGLHIYIPLSALFLFASLVLQAITGSSSKQAYLQRILQNLCNT